MSLLAGRGRFGRAANPSPPAAPTLTDTISAPPDGAYVTNGDKLFHIEVTLWDNAKGEPLVELEDCATLELILCPARAVAALGLRSVTPTAAA